MGDQQTHWLDLVNDKNYTQLRNWSGTLQAPNQISSAIYTSDYGSYSSQESNHSGTTALYSNMIDCEEVLNKSQPNNFAQPGYPQPSRKESRTVKPVPPPRIDSKALLQTQKLTSKVKKISFDDLNYKQELKANSDPKNSAPSYATLPRKKKLSNSDKPATPSSTAAQVTWMKEIAKKEDLLHSESVSSHHNPATQPKQLHGILKNGTSATRQSDRPAYINRNAVQKILDQQKKVSLNRKVATPAANTYSQQYRSMPNLEAHQNYPYHSPTHSYQKPWEYSPTSNGTAVQPTAHVLGIIEPPGQHARQSSAETEFEFPPPPSDTDIAQILSADTSFNTAQNHDTNPTDTRNMELRISPVSTSNSGSIAITSPQLETTSGRRVPEIFSSGLLNKQHVSNSSTSQQEQLDIVLPPPPEFQEGKPVNSYTRNPPTYGDYEILSPDAQYDTNTASSTSAIHRHHANHSINPRKKSRAPNQNPQPYVPQANMNIGYYNRTTAPHNQKRYVYSHGNNGFRQSGTEFQSDPMTHHHQYSTEL